MTEKPVFKIRASAIADIKGGAVGLTDAQKVSLADYVSRERGMHPKGLKLTENMRQALIELRQKEANPELPQGAKTYVKKWLKQYRWKRHKEIKSKYIKKGNATEQDGFTLMVSVLGLGMVRSQTERFNNSYSTGTCDLLLPKRDLVIDNKSSWDWETFPRYEDELPEKDKRYEDQIQGYMEGYNVNNGWVVYTLVDCPLDILEREVRWLDDPNEKQKVALNLIYTRDAWNEAKEALFPSADDIEFVEIPAHERVKVFKFERDREHAKDVELRVRMCQEYVNELIEK